jgi:RHS repeat-associated protein
MKIVGAETTTFVYDGWNMIEENLDDGTTTSTKRNVWGLDLSGGIYAAGGIGGLVAATSGQGSSMSHAFFDGTGNLVQLMSQTGTLIAHYEYGTAGTVIRKEGQAASENRFRYSTKYHDLEGNLFYAGFRFYDVQIGRWNRRDPIGHDGGANLYALRGNRPVGSVDPFGLDLFAVDGTGSTFERLSNVRLFYERHQEAKAFWNGPGTTFPYASGILRGSGSSDIVEGVVKEICSRWRNNRGLKVDLVGFSRGAAIVNEVAWVLNNRGCNCTAPSERSSFRRFVGLDFSSNFRVRVRFLGLFDTVHSMGEPQLGLSGLSFSGNGDWHTRSIAPNVDWAAQAMARHERRSFFRPSRLEPESVGTENHRQWFDGVHSDVGGHVNFNQNLQLISLRFMVREAASAGVPIDTNGLVTDDQIRSWNTNNLLEPSPNNPDFPRDSGNDPRLWANN